MFHRIFILAIFYEMMFEQNVSDFLGYIYTTPGFKEMLHGMIPNDDFYRNSAWQCWHIVATI